ncbi:hypothetical protein APHAL10511_008250, partial [Amanita phalloides]
TSIEVEWIFSHGCLLLLHTWSQLSTQTSQSMLCVSRWTSLNLVKMDDIRAVSELKDMVGDVDAMDDGWDSILLN